jgi:hypothetical protein
MYKYGFLAIHAGHAYQAVLDTHSVHALHAAKTAYVINGFGAVHAGHAIVAMRALVVSLLERSFFVGLHSKGCSQILGWKLLKVKNTQAY